MTEYIMAPDKNGKEKYYRIEDGKKKAIKKAEYEAGTVAAADTEATEVAEATENKVVVKQNRWVKVHEHGHGNFESKKNVIDVTIGANRAQAEVLYSTRQVRNFEKAAYWLLHSLGVAHAEEIVNLAEEQIRSRAQNTSKDDDQMAVDGDGWSCVIDNMGDGEFKAQLTWTFRDKEEDCAE